MSTTATLTRPTSACPATPCPQTVVSSAPTGNWQHPHFDEIHRRLNENVFGERNVRSLLWNSIFLIVTFFVTKTLSSHPILDNLAKAAHPYLDYAIVALRVLPLWNIALALWPLLRTKDDLSDIPLTPSQRELLGLEPASRPASEGSVYITPPKYARSPRSLSINRSRSGSPYSDSALGSPFNGTPYSPSASPLFHRALQRDPARRLSLGTPSPLGLGRSSDQFTSSMISNTPSPTVGRASSVTLNSRWLYERGRVGSR